jgi:hypothetical protein
MNAQRALGASKQQDRVAAFIQYIDATPNRRNFTTNGELQKL